MRTPVIAVSLSVFLAGCGGSGGRTQTFEMPTSVMEPTIHCARPAPGCEANVSDFVVTTETTDIKRGDIVVLIAPQSAEQACGFGGRYFKRIIGLPGETWQERDGYVYINGQLLDEPYIKDDRRDRESHAKQTIPDDHYFVMADNRLVSCDSRLWGTVPESNIVETVVEIKPG